jgi:hypothetical protein
MLHRMGTHKGRWCTVLCARSLQQPYLNRVPGIGTPALRLAWMVADVGEYERNGNSICENCKPTLEVSVGHALNKFARIHMDGTGGGACRRLFLNALCFPAPNLFPIHIAISRRTITLRKLWLRFYRNAGTKPKLRPGRNNYA